MKQKYSQQNKGFTPLHFFSKVLREKFMLSSQKSTINSFSSKKSGAGFTLIELLVVVSIMGLLASVILVSVNSARQKARDSKRLSEANQIAKGLEIFFNQAFAYPTGSGYVCGSAGCGGVKFGSSILSVNQNGQITNLTPTYMTYVPSAPTPADGNCASSGFQSNEYFYETNNSGNDYTLTFCLGRKTGDVDAGVRYVTPKGIR